MYLQSGKCTDGRDVPGIDIVLEWSSGDRWPADPAGLCCFFRWEAGLSNHLQPHAVIFSVLQTRIFIWGNAVSPSLYWGFLSDDKTLWGVLWYLIQMSGIFFVGAVVLVFLLKKRQQRAALISFLFPAAFLHFLYR